jgi:hypothetical protein
MAVESFADLQLTLPDVELWKHNGPAERAKLWPNLPEWEQVTQLTLMRDSEPYRSLPVFSTEASAQDFIIEKGYGPEVVVVPIGSAIHDESPSEEGPPPDEETSESGYVPAAQEEPTTDASP